MKKLAIFMPIKINSERVKNKSIKNLYERPLLNWSLETLDSLGVNIYIYTSSISLVKDCIDFDYKNLIFINRSEHLDGSNVLGEEIYRNFSLTIPALNYLLVHCTSPFVRAESYNDIIEIGNSNKYDSISTCYKVQSFCYFDNKKINFNKRIKTQDLEPIIVENSAAYFFSNNLLESGNRSGDNHFFYELSKIESIDLDYNEDFEFLENIYNKIS